MRWLPVYAAGFVVAWALGDFRQRDGIGLAAMAAVILFGHLVTHIYRRRHRSTTLRFTPDGLLDMEQFDDEPEVDPTTVERINRALKRTD